MRCLLLVAASLCAGLAAAGQYDGVWLQAHTLPPSDNKYPAVQSFHFPSVASADDHLFMTTKGSNYTYMYDHLSHTWTKLAPTPDGLFYSAADVVYAAGSLLLWGGKGGDQFADLIYTLSTVNPAGGWHRRATTGPGPLARSGHTLTVLNGLVYMIGGWNENTYFRGIWAMDLSVLTQPGTVTAEWKAVIPNAGFGGNLFSARNSHTVCTYESRMYLFGGFYHNIQAGGAYTNDCNNPAVQCTWFNDLWKWTPPYGVPGPVANTWQQVQPASNVVPAPRAGHVAHFLEDSRMLVFGGYGVNNAPLNDLWQFTEHDMIWTKLEPAGSRPPALTTPLGAHIGKHLLIYTGGSTMYDYMPYNFEPAAFSPPPAVSDCVKHKDVKGINAGLVLAILIGIAQLVFGILIWRGMGGGVGKGASPYAPMSSA